MRNKLYIFAFLMFLALGNSVLALTTGGIITKDGDYSIHTFLTNGSFNISASIYNATILIIGGGGGGGEGGGGAGGLIYNSSFNITTNMNVIVGYGGLGSTAPATAGTYGKNGTPSYLGSIMAYGGGAGGVSGGEAWAGGSGGGAYADGGTVRYGGNGTPGQGNKGGSMVITAPYPAGGGGGAGSVGRNGNATGGGQGGQGLTYSINGSSVCYAGGGGGGIASGGDYYSLADCGGGRGRGNSMADSAINGTGGGGGGVGTNSPAGRGGNGIVIIRYLNYTCSPSWSCSAYGACNSSNILPCTAVTDNNSCGGGYGGDLNTYDGVCDFFPAPAWLQNPPNISANKSQAVSVRLNASGANVTYSINNTGLCTVSDGNLFTFNSTISVYASLEARASNPGGNVTGVFSLNISCFPAWICSSFDVCTNLSIKSCLAVSDSNTCGANFTGNLSAYDSSCTPAGPSVIGGTMDLFNYDLNNSTNLIIFGILIFLWLGLAGLSAWTGSILFRGMFAVVGIILCFMCAGIHVALALGMGLFSVLGLIFIK